MTLFTFSFTVCTHRRNQPNVNISILFFLWYFFFFFVVLIKYLHKLVISHKEEIWLAKLFLIHFIYVPTVVLLLCFFPSVTNLLARIPYWNHQHSSFTFCLLSNGCLCVCCSFTNIKGCLQNLTAAVNPVWMPSSLARDWIFALFSSREFISGMMFFFLIVSTAVSNCQERHTQTWTFMSSFSCLLLYCFALIYLAHKVLWVKQLGTGNPVRNGLQDERHLGPLLQCWTPPVKGWALLLALLVMSGSHCRGAGITQMNIRREDLLQIAQIANKWH